VLLARATSDRADNTMHESMGLIQRLLHAAESGERMGSVIETLMLQALAHQAQGDIPAALVPLERALTLAEPEGYVRMFVDEGHPMAAVLAQSIERRAQNDSIKAYAERLLSVFLDDDKVTRWHGDTIRAVHDQPVTRSSLHPVTPAMVEPLSERERDVLRLLRTDLSGPEIARELMVSLNTLRTHTNNIYIKLEVNNRRAAVRRAEELDVF